MHRLTTLERAYELARTGPCVNVDEIRAQLKRERFEAVDGHLHGSMITGQLRALCRAKRVVAPAGAIAD
jgi:hypothetical protein